jgi:DNA-binding transcriptional LysR family regulator
LGCFCRIRQWSCTTDLAAENFDAVLRAGKQRSSDLKVHRLPPVHLSTVASPAYLSRHGAPRRLEDLRQHNCLQFILPKGVRPWLFKKKGGGVARIAPQGSLTTNNEGGLLQAMLAGLGMVQVPSFLIATAVTEGRLVEVLRDFAAPPVPLAVMFPPGRERSPKIRVFINAITELLSALR